MPDTKNHSIPSDNAMPNNASFYLAIYLFYIHNKTHSDD